jgi:hypothetical protein
MRDISRRAIRLARVLPELCVLYLVSFLGLGNWELRILGYRDGRGCACRAWEIGRVTGGGGVVFQCGNEIRYALDRGVNITFHFMLTMQNMRRIRNLHHDHSRFLKRPFLLCRSSCFGLHKLLRRFVTVHKIKNKQDILACPPFRHLANNEQV